MKKTHTEAGYKEIGFPHRFCGNCTMYRRGQDADHCTLVEDPIEHHGWCRYHEAKT